MTSVGQCKAWRKETATRSSAPGHATKELQSQAIGSSGLQGIRRELHEVREEDSASSEQLHCVRRAVARICEQFKTELNTSEPADTQEMHSANYEVLQAYPDDKVKLIKGQAGEERCTGPSIARVQRAQREIDHAASVPSKA